METGASLRRALALQFSAGGICRSLTCRQARAEGTRGPPLCERRAQVKRCADLAWCVMAVDPDSVMVPPTPMSWNPNPVDLADVIARSMDIIRPVTYFDIHNDSICHGRHCRENCQKYSNFSFHTYNSIL